MHDKIGLTPERVTRLNDLLLEKKFVEDGLYPGAPNERIRMESQLRMNRFISDVFRLLARGTRREELFARAKVLKEEFQHDDTEEIERADDYLGSVMQIVGIPDWAEYL